MRVSTLIFSVSCLALGIDCRGLSSGPQVPECNNRSKELGKKYLGPDGCNYCWCDKHLSDGNAEVKTVCEKTDKCSKKFQMNEKLIGKTLQKGSQMKSKPTGINLPISAGQSDYIVAGGRHGEDGSHGNNNIVAGESDYIVGGGRQGNDYMATGGRHGDDLVAAAGQSHINEGHGNDNIVTGESDYIVGGGRQGNDYMATGGRHSEDVVAAAGQSYNNEGGSHGNDNIVPGESDYIIGGGRHGNDYMIEHFY